MKSKPGYETLDSHSSQLREKIERVERDYPRLTSVINGETALVDIVKEYETRFYQLVNHGTVLLDVLRVRRLQDDVAEYTSELNSFVETLQDIRYFVSESYKLDNSRVTDYRKELRHELEALACNLGFGVSCAATFGGIFLGAGGIFLGALFPPAGLVALIGAGTAIMGAGGALLSVGGATVSWLSGNEPSNYRLTRREIKSFFGGLHDKAEMLDKDIRSAYAIE